MSKEITDKRFCVVTIGLGRFWVDGDQAKRITSMLNEDRIVKIGEDTIRTKEIRGVVTGERIKDIDRNKQGEWQCSHGYWHEKHQQCGHNLVK